MSDKITIDPEFHGLIPPLTVDERRQLEANIIADKGCRDALITWRGLLLDGHNRHEICERLDLPYKVVELPLTDRESAMAWIINNQFGRRNLNDFQRAELVRKLKPLLAGEAKENQRKSEGRGQKGLQNSANLNPVDTRAKLAEAAGVSHDTIAKTEKVLDHGVKPLQAMARAGEVSINAAAAVAELPKEEQRELVKAGPAAVKEKAADLRKERQRRVRDEQEAPADDESEVEWDDSGGEQLNPDDYPVPDEPGPAEKARHVPSLILQKVIGKVWSAVNSFRLNGTLKALRKDASGEDKKQLVTQLRQVAKEVERLATAIEEE